MFLCVGIEVKEEEVEQYCRQLYQTKYKEKYEQGEYDEWEAEDFMDDDAFGPNIDYLSFPRDDLPKGANRCFVLASRQIKPIYETWHVQKLDLETISIAIRQFRGDIADTPFKDYNIEIYME